MNDIETRINDRIQIMAKKNLINTNNISDRYHSFGELYKHRIHLYIALCKQLWYINNIRDAHCVPKDFSIKRSRVHDDGLNVWKEWGMFILQLETPNGQISYHLDKEYWDKCDFAEEVIKANKWDGHTSDDVLERLLKIL